MTIDYVRQRTTADRMIKKYGQLSKLRRTAGDRDCYALEVVLTASQRQQLKNEKDRFFLISAVDLDVPPAKDDALVWTQAGVELVLRQTAPVAPLAPGGVVVYYELQVQG